MKAAFSLLLSLALLAMICTWSIPGMLPGKPGEPTLVASQSPALQAVTRTQVAPAAGLDFPTCDPVPVPPFQPASSSGALSFVVAGIAGPAYSASAVLPGVSSAGDLTPTLRALADASGMYIGVSTAPTFLAIPEYASLVTREFNTLIPENAMKWEVIHPGPDQYDFTQGDAIVSFARAHGMAVYGHTLVWELQQPQWLTQGQHTRDEWIQILCQHIKTVVGHYRGQIYAWHVVNEAFDNSGSLRDTLWLRKIGPEYIAMAFQWAHEADPDALLIYNDDAGEGMNAKSQAIYTMAETLLQRGIPIDGVGMQMHVWLYGPPTPQDLAANMQRLAGLGLLAHITEMDVRTQLSLDSPAEKAAAQAEVYRQAFNVCLEASNCNVFMTWGLTDRYSWIPGYTGHPDAPLLFDAQGNPKPAYYAIWQSLSNAVQRQN